MNLFLYLDETVIENIGFFGILFLSVLYSHGHLRVERMDCAYELKIILNFMKLQKGFFYFIIFYYNNIYGGLPSRLSELTL